MQVPEWEQHLQQGLYQDNNSLCSCWCSRIYLVRQGKINVTTDHSLVQEMVELGQISAEEARTHNYRNVINAVS